MLYFCKAYKLFSEGKTVLQVAIALNLRDHEVTTLYTEYCNLSGLDSLCAVYREVKGDIWPFVNLHKSKVFRHECVQCIILLAPARPEKRLCRNHQ